MTRRVLFVQHASGLGGSCVSLAYTIEALDRTKYEPIVALIQPTKQVVEYHASLGVEVIPWPGVGTFENTTGEWATLRRPHSVLRLLRELVSYRRTLQRTSDLVRHVRPDIVHLNSVVLLPSAYALHREAIPFVWHVRESPPPAAHVRTLLQRHALTHWPARAFYLTEAERRLWVGVNVGMIVPDFVHSEEFGEYSRAEARRQLNIPDGARVVFFAGGVSPIKGGITLMKALPRVRNAIENLMCLMPSCEAPPQLKSRMLQAFAARAGARAVYRAMGDIESRHGLTGICRRSAYAQRSEIQTMLHACDVAVFPATENHFARPAIEAAAAGKPVIASRLPSLEDIVVDRTTGILVEPGDAEQLAAALVEVLANQEWSRELGTAAKARALTRYASNVQMPVIEAVYEQVVSKDRVS